MQDILTAASTLDKFHFIEGKSSFTAVNIYLGSKLPALQPRAQKISSFPDDDQAPVQV